MSYKPNEKIQSIENVGEGITFQSTAGHGYYKLERAQNALIPKVFRNAGGWYEEDCEGSKVAVFFPYNFTPDVVAEAYKLLKNWFPKEYMGHFGEQIDIEDSIVLRDDYYKEKYKTQFVVICAWGDWAEDVPKGFVKVAARRDIDKTEELFLVPYEEYTKRGELPGGKFVIDLDRHKKFTQSY